MKKIINKICELIFAIMTLGYFLVSITVACVLFEFNHPIYGILLFVGSSIFAEKVDIKKEEK